MIAAVVIAVLAGLWSLTWDDDRPGYDEAWVMATIENNRRDRSSAG